MAKEIPRFKRLFDWAMSLQMKNLGPDQLVEALSVEKTHAEELPEPLRPELRAFRKLRQEERRIAAHVYLGVKELARDRTRVFIWLKTGAGRKPVWSNRDVLHRFSVRATEGELQELLKVFPRRRFRVEVEWREGSMTYRTELED